ncbi:MAG: M28 family metallopeptidase [Candidatus Koribacter versatilis]|uniref:M28 family metallopeptidase n=1 Tax=Candidatus Korobacter versatilis TaxID=658062 RepID=A0A932A7A1_9BACT|nr:M28 family metallopeptidase [Candidatus Koribacter versatilis]
MEVRKREVLVSSSLLLLLVAAGVTALFAQQNGGAAIMGFSPKAAAAEANVETKFKTMISPEKAREFHRIFTAEPHPAGTARNNELAQYIAHTWKKQGLDVAVHRYDVLNSSPRELALEMVSPIQYKAGLREAAYAEDPDTSNPRVSPGYSGMSTSGEVTAQIVYAHSGNPEDYAVLKKAGISVRGRVVLVRYSNPYSYRGFKALTAEREGAVAILIYSDPAEDGFRKGKVFPDGPWGPETHIQRGAITYDFIVPGDPLTPGWASVPGAKQIRPEEAQSLPKIMAMPLSWHDAQPLLENMGGPKAPKSWGGGLPITYRLGGEGRVHVKIDMDTSVKPNYVVEGRIRGSELPDEWVVLGNHRDAWEFGGVDPSSGTASMMEMTRAFGDLLRQGVRPRRTLIFCSWDGEEVGLTGSTEWGEDFAEQLRKKLVAYLNVDSSTSGPDFDASAVGSLSPMLVETSKTLTDPSGKSLYEAWRASTERSRREAKGKQPVADATLVDTRIGSGSDHTVFLNYLGRPTMLLSFTGPYGVYHSMYDNFYWMNHVGDPGYRYHALMSQLWGVVAMRLANSELQPFDFAVYGSTIRDWLKEIEAKKGARGNVDVRGALARAAAFQAAGRDLDAATKAALARGADPKVFDRVNGQMMEVEANWLNPAGIPGRPWFKHILYAARYTYAHLELPGITEAVEKGDWKTAQEQVRVLEAALDKNTALLKQARAELEKTAGAAETK